MTTLVLNATHSFGGWFHGFMERTSKAFQKSGYIKAGKALEQAGYHKEAQDCYKMARDV